MAEKRKVQKSAQTILNEKFAKGEITKDYFVRRTRELAREQAASSKCTNSEELEKMKEEIVRLNEVINKMSESAKEKERTYVEHIEELEQQLNNTGNEEDTLYTNYEELKSYLQEHLMLVEGLDVETNKRLVTNVIIKGNKEEENPNYYSHVAIAMVGMSCGPHLVLDDNGVLKEAWKLHTVTGEDRDLFIETLVDKLYSCELCRGYFGAIPTFVSVGDRHDCSLYADDFDWYFEEQDEYLKEASEKEFSFEKDFEDEECETSCKNCKCDKENEKECNYSDYTDLLGTLMLASLFL